MKKKVLIVDDEPSTRILVRRILEGHIERQYEVFEAENGTECIMAVERELMSRHSPEDDASMSSFQYTEGILKSRHAQEYHEGILNALIERDLPRAIQLMDAHLKEVEERVQLFLK